MNFLTTFSSRTFYSTYFPGYQLKQVEGSSQILGFNTACAIYYFGTHMSISPSQQLKFVHPWWCLARQW